MRSNNVRGNTPASKEEKKKRIKKMKEKWSVAQLELLLQLSREELMCVCVCVYMHVNAHLCVQDRRQAGLPSHNVERWREERRNRSKKKKKQRNTREVRLFGFHPADTRPSVRLNTQHLRSVKNAVYGVVEHRQVRVLRKHTYTHTHTHVHICKYGAEKKVAMRRFIHLNLYLAVCSFFVYTRTSNTTFAVPLAACNERERESIENLPHTKSDDTASFFSSSDIFFFLLMRWMKDTRIYKCTYILLYIYIYVCVRVLMSKHDYNEESRKIV